MAEHETIADIIAEMRGMGNYQRYSGDYARVLANRLDAAHRREAGDCAKLREALEAFVRAYDEPIELDNIEATSKAYEQARAALAAPPRNCDIYNSETCRMAYHLHGDGLMTMQAFADWLFAPATEKEGGAK